MAVLKFLTVFEPEPRIFLLHWVLQIMQPALPLPFFLQEGRRVWLRKEIQREREREEGLSAGGIARFCHPSRAKREDPPKHKVGSQKLASRGTGLLCALSTHAPGWVLVGEKHLGLRRQQGRELKSSGNGPSSGISEGWPGEGNAHWGVMGKEASTETPQWKVPQISI